VLIAGSPPPSRPVGEQSKYDEGESEGNWNYERDAEAV
jgi:hypothetical protein